MCLLIHHKPGTDLSGDVIRNILTRNSDGFGAMWAEHGRVQVIKNVNPTAREIEYIYDRYLKARECVMHFRMRTHGNIDYDNCHPYEVFDSLHMAHNGVMSNMDTREHSKSDTWHLVEDYLKPMLQRDPTLVFTRPFQKMLGHYIGGGNKLAFVHKTGQIAVINRGSGFDSKGSWFSNTYAWTPEKFGFHAPPKAKTTTYAKSTVVGGSSTTPRKSSYVEGWSESRGSFYEKAEAESKDSGKFQSAKAEAVKARAEAVVKGSKDSTPTNVVNLPAVIKV